MSWILREFVPFTWWIDPRGNYHLVYPTLDVVCGRDTGWAYEVRLAATFEILRFDLAGLYEFLSDEFAPVGRALEV